MAEKILVAIGENRRDFTHDEMQPRVSRLFTRIDECGILNLVQRRCQQDNAAFVIHLSAQHVRDNPDDITFAHTITTHSTFWPKKEVSNLCDTRLFPSNEMWIVCHVYLNRDESDIKCITLVTTVGPKCGCCNKAIPNKKQRVLCPVCALNYYCTDKCRKMDKRNHTEACSHLKRWFSEKLFEN